MNLQNAIYNKKVMGDNSITFNFDDYKPTDINIGDSIDYRSSKMIVRRQPDVLKYNSQLYNNTVVFEGLIYQLNDMPIMHLDDITFSYVGRAEQFLLLIVDSMRTISPEWVAGFSEETEEKWISFDDETCLSALEKVCKEFNLEYDISGYTISLKVKVGTDTGLVLEYGKGKGLYNLQRQSVQNENVYTIIKAFGSTKNLPESYNGRRLKLGEDLQNNVDLYGKRIGVYKNDDIFPHFEGSVESVSAGGLMFTDSKIDFNVRDYLLEGLTGKVVFKSGELSGKQFEITSIGENSIGIKPIIEADDYTYPNSTFKINVGDRYTFVDIKMPDSYVQSALDELRIKAQEYLMKVSAPQVTYTCSIDLLHMKRIGVLLDAGDYVTIVDNELGVNKKIRIQSVSYPADYPENIRNGMTFTCEIGDVITYNTLGKINQSVQENKAEIRDVNYTSRESSRNNIMAIREFRNMVFDPDGNMATPLVEAMSAIFGSESQYFDLIDISINVSGDTISISEGKLVHYALQGAMGDTWELSGYINNSLVTLDSYYLSARCSKTTNQGNWVLSQQPIGTEDVSGYYHFNLGVVSSNADGNRQFKPTKMFTTIDGGNILTNRLIADIIETGDLIAKNFNLERGKAGPLEVYDDYIGIGTNNSDANTESIRITDRYMSLYSFGSQGTERVTFNWNVFGRGSPSSDKYAVQVENTLSNPTGVNTALMVDARGGGKNKAIEIRNGYIEGGSWSNRSVGNGTTQLTNSDDFIAIPSTGSFLLKLPSNPENGKTIQFVRAHSTGVTLQFDGNGKNVLYQGVDHTDVTNVVNGYWGTIVFISSVNKWFLASN